MRGGSHGQRADYEQDTETSQDVRLAAVRFASVYKGFEQVDDFARELGLLNKDATPQAARELRREERGTSGTATP